MQDIPRYGTFTKIDPIDKGWSQDKKYYVETSSGVKLLLRLTPASAYQRKQAQYQALSKISSLGINTPRPVDFGLCSDGQEVYTLLTWVEGKDAISVLPALPQERQFDLGRKAGAMLRQIHTISGPENLKPWGARYNEKIDRNTIEYKNCGIKLPQEETILDFIGRTRHLLDEREQTIQQGDYHAGNMVITPEERIGIIDFNRSDFGDPWEEFNRIGFSVNASRAFAAGNIQGYFLGNPPQEFFQLMALYIACNTLASIPWAMAYGQQEVETMLHNAREMLDYYRGFGTVIPTWYSDHI